MSSKFFGNKLSPNTKADKNSKIKTGKGKTPVKQIIKKAGRGKVKKIELTQSISQDAFGFIGSYVTNSMPYLKAGM